MAFENILRYTNELLNSLSEDNKIFFSLILYTILILIYSIFVWKYYRFLSKKQIIELNLSQYNYSQHPVLEKVFAIMLFTLEYLIILPFLVIFWFGILSLLMLILSESGDTLQIFLIASAIITSTRITSYINEDLSRDIAKILPLTVLVVFAIGQNSISFNEIIDRFYNIQGLLNNIFIFLIFIFIVEFVLRLLYSIVQFYNSNEEE